MVNTKSFIKIGKGWDLGEEVMKEVNEFISENKIERSDILEFRTSRSVSCKSYIDDSFEVVISWWK